ncbi:hypothetical protein MN116_007561 [Schistosoma mekongi]|uniref:Uncharacterized protein n=1 Tax=Schistosoma mekongi TaxID=38744 RepID=A0AAE1Z8E2_SCHME|nr:hypothetical protein MN116_007561 [Schistosoma mekongi]
MLVSYISENYPTSQLKCVCGSVSRRIQKRLKPFGHVTLSKSFFNNNYFVKLIIISELLNIDNAKSLMIQLNNTISSIRNLSGQLSSDHNNSVGATSTFLGMESSSLSNNTTCSPIVIIEIVASVTITTSMITGMYVKSLSLNLRKVLFAIACLLTITGIIFTIVGIIFKANDLLRILFQTLSCSSWCCTVFIVVLWTTWYLMTHYDPTRYSLLFVGDSIWNEFGLDLYIPVNLGVYMYATDVSMEGFSDGIYMV